jgi:hypothetical protein
MLYDTVPLGFVEALGSKIRVLRRRASGLRDEEYRRVEVLTLVLLPLSSPSCHAD